MAQVKETLCTSCIKLSVCKYKDDFEKLLKQVDNIEKRDIFFVKVVCNEWIAKQTYRGDVTQ